MHENVSYQVEYTRRERTGPPVGFVPDGDEIEVSIAAPSAIERPRERMFAFGAGALSNVELVALLLGGGRSEQRALTLLQQVGGIGGLLRCVPGELLESHSPSTPAASEAPAAWGWPGERGKVMPRPPSPNERLTDAPDGASGGTWTTSRPTTPTSSSGCRFR